MVDAWKLATVGLGLVLVVVLVRQHYRRPEFAVARAKGQAVPDTRGTQQHAVMTAILGAKKVAEGAKRDLLGPDKADDRDEQKKLRVA